MSLSWFSGCGLNRGFLLVGASAKFLEAEPVGLIHGTLIYTMVVGMVHASDSWMVFTMHIWF